MGLGLLCPLAKDRPTLANIHPLALSVLRPACFRLAVARVLWFTPILETRTLLPMYMISRAGSAKNHRSESKPSGTRRSIVIQHEIGADGEQSFKITQ